MLAGSYATGSSRAAGIDPRRSSTPSPGSTAPSRRSSETPTSTFLLQSLLWSLPVDAARQLAAQPADGVERGEGDDGEGDAVDGATDAVELEAEQADDEGDGRPEAHGAGVDAWPHDGGLDQLQGDQHADDEEPARQSSTPKARSIAGIPPTRTPINGIAVSTPTAKPRAIAAGRPIHQQSQRRRRRR